MWNLTAVSLYTALTEEEPLLPGSRLAAALRMLCGPGVSTELQGLPAEQGSQTRGGVCPILRRIHVKNPGNKLVFSVKGGLGCGVVSVIIVKLCF